MISEIKQLPYHPDLVIDPVLLDETVQIYGGMIKNKVILSSNPDLSIDPQIEALCNELKCGKHYGVVIRRAISAMMIEDYQPELVHSAKRELHKLDISASYDTFRQDNTRSERGRLPGPNNYRLAEAIAAVLWDKIITRCTNEYKPLPTNTIVVTT